MWFNFALKLWLLSITIEIKANIDRSVSWSGEVHNHISIGNIQNETNFNDLNDDVLHIIFSELNLPDLLATFEIKPKYAFFAANAFRHKYLNYQVLIFERDNEDGINQEYFYENTDDKLLIILDHEMALKVMKFFGCWITNLLIEDGALPGNHSSTVNKVANENLPFLNRFFSSLTKENTFQQFLKPFEHVEHFFCSLKQTQIGHFLPLNRIFPNIKRLTVSIGDPNIDYDIFNIHIQHLEHLDISLMEMEFISDHRQLVEEILQKNTQIISIKMRLLPRDYITVINQHLPGLVNVTLDQLDLSQVDAVLMKNVKHFTLHTSLPRSIDKLILPKLESFKMIYDHEMINDWLVFFEKHKNVKILEFKMMSNEQMPDHIQRILENLPVLSELTMKNVNGLGIEEILMITNKNINLIRFNIQFNRYDDLNATEIRELLANEWHSTNVPIKYGRVLITFEKK